MMKTLILQVRENCFLENKTKKKYIYIYTTTTNNNNELGHNITKTYLYNFDPLKPHFYIVKLGFTGVNIIFRIVLKNTHCGTHWNRLIEAVLTSTHNLCFEQKYEKYQNFLSENFLSFGGKIISTFE